MKNNKVGITPLDPYAELDIMEIYNSSTSVKSSVDGFLSMVLQCPAKVTLKRAFLQSSDELKYLMKTHWLAWQRNLYIWLTIYGVCPWYFIKIRGTIHKYPKTPPFGSGYIETFLDKNYIQGFQWKWNGGKIEKKMKFEVRSHPPTVNGGFTTPIMALIPDYRMIKIARGAKEQAWVMQATPQHVIEYNPSRSIVETDSRLININRARADSDENTTYGEIDSRRDMQSVRVMDLIKTLRKADAMNAQRDKNQFIYMHTDKKKPVEKLAGRTIYLNANFTYKQIAAPKVDADIPKLSAMLESKASIIMDFPSKNMTDNKRTSTQAANSLRFVNERIKEWIGFFENRTKNALLIAYGDQLQNDINNAFDFMFSVQDELIVEMPCTPLASFEDLEKYVDRGIMDQKDFAKHAFHLSALPESEIKLKDDMIQEKLYGETNETNKKKKQKIEDCG